MSDFMKGYKAYGDGASFIAPRGVNKEEWYAGWDEAEADCNEQDYIDSLKD